MKSNFRKRINAITKHITRKRVLLLSVPIVAFLIITPVVTYASLKNEISNPERLMNSNNSGIILKDKNGKIFYEYGVVNDGQQLSLDEISDHIEDALIASEDRGFYSHDGFSARGIAGAIRDNVTDGNVDSRGGSTITQQLVKNKLLTTDKTLLRKYQEVTMAIAIEREYTKTEILEMYLNSVYFGEGAFGIGDAAKTYFGKKPNDLTIAESAMLVGLLPAPSTYSPVSGDTDKAAERQKIVLQAMSDTGKIDQQAFDAALAETLAYAQPADENFTTAQHFTMMVIDELQKEYGEERIIRSGFVVTTTLDLDWQQKAEQTVRDRVAVYTAQGGRNAGLVTIDPKSGGVRALVGSVDWNNTSFGKVNMALMARQPGSSFKPIYYAEALDKRLITPATVLQDEAKTYGTDYRPENYDFRFRGDITVRNALAQSLNIPAIDVMQKLGVDESSAVAKRMGISTVTEPETYGLSLALGTAETKLYEMVNAYAAFANEGKQYSPTLITNIQNKYGDTVYEQEKAEPRKVVSQDAAFLMSSILSDEKARAPLYGSSLNVPGRTVAVKTGTTNDNKDAWTIGYTPSVVTGVWVGNNENEPMRGIAGGSGAGQIWRTVMTDYLVDTNEGFKQPSTIVKSRACQADKSGSYEEYFIRGTEKGFNCAPKPRVEPNQNERSEKKEEKDKEENEKTEETEGGRGGEETVPDEEPEVEPKPEPEPEPEDPPEETDPETNTAI